MAERRMFAKTIIDSDAFLDMPLSTQCLYFHLSMRADDDGFINNPKKIQRMIAASEDDLKLLITKNFIIPFESGIVVIKHWKIHNYIRCDRYKETVYQEEKSLLIEKDNKAYTTGIPSDNQVVYQMDTQVRLGKDSIGKYNNNIVQNTEAEAMFEELWLLYPVKKGKGQVSLSAKKRIAKVGIDEMRRAIDRYKAELAKDADWRKPQNGSTFFNSGYVDYLDCNYEPQNTTTNSNIDESMTDLDDLF